MKHLGKYLMVILILSSCTSLVAVRNTDDSKAKLVEIYLTTKGLVESNFLTNLKESMKSDYQSVEHQPADSICQLFNVGFHLKAVDNGIIVADSKIMEIENGWYYNGQKENVPIYMDPAYISLDLSDKNIIASMLWLRLYTGDNLNIEIGYALYFFDPINNKSIKVHLKPGIMNLPGFFTIYKDGYRNKITSPIVAIVGGTYEQLLDPSALIGGITEQQRDMVLNSYVDGIQGYVISRGLTVVDRSLWEGVIKDKKMTPTDLFSSEMTSLVWSRIPCDYVIMPFLKTIGDQYSGIFSLIIKTYRVSDGVIINSSSERIFVKQ
jgi:hypothetical protein